MRKLVKMFSVAVLLGALVMTGGCGGDRDETIPNPSTTTGAITATLNADGTATTPATTTTVAAGPGTQGYLAAVKVELAPTTVITAKNADGSTKKLTAAPSFTFTAPADSTTTKSGTNGVPVPAGFIAVVSTSGAVEIELNGADSATFNPPITVTMPVPGKAVGAVIKVFSVSGTTYTSLGDFTVTTAGLVSFPVSSLSWKVGDPVFQSATGTTGGTGSAGSSF